jgi:signal transduction histidine kinase
MTAKEESKQEKMLGVNGLMFSGAITASITHELNNVMSIIDQTIGLLDDLIVTASPDHPIGTEQLERIVEKIQLQKERGVEFIKRLNTFSHTVDEPSVEIDVNQLMENFYDLTHRFAVLKRAEYKISYAQSQILIRNNPFLLLQAVYICLRQALAEAQKGDTINLVVENSDSNIHLKVERTPLDQSLESFSTEYLELVMDRIGGNININNDNEHTTYDLSIPLSGD